jgi:beta-lactamase class A
VTMRVGVVLAGVFMLAARIAAQSPAQPAPAGALREQVTALITASGAEAAVAFSTLDGRDRLMIGEDTVFHAASTMKVPVMVELFRQAQSGDVSLDAAVPVTNQFASVVDGSPFTLDAADDSDKAMYQAIGGTRTYRELCESMITMSSNLATNVLIGHLGAANVASTMKGYGAEGMVVRRGVEDNKAFAQGLNNTATAKGLHNILLAIARHEAVSSGASDEMIAILSRQVFRKGIPAGVPPGTVVAHKTGTITKIHHDGGIVMGPRPYVLVVLTRGFDDEAVSDTLVAAISKLVYASVAVPLP